MFLCPEYRSCLKYSVKYADHHLLIELWTLRQHCRSVEIFQFENVGSPLGSFRSDLRCMDLCKFLTVEEISECSCKSFLDSEFGTLPDISKGNGTIVQFCFQRCVSIWKLQAASSRLPAHLRFLRSPYGFQFHLVLFHSLLRRLPLRQLLLL